MIVNAHEHLESRNEVPAFLKANQEVGIGLTVAVGSPIYTITLRPGTGFDQYHENNLELLEVARDWPGRFCVFPTLDPLATDINLDLLADYRRLGATGIKFYHGNNGEHGLGPFHVCALDDERTFPVWEICEAEEIPVILHVNINFFERELWRLLDRFQKIRMIVPHLMLCKNNEDRLARVADMLAQFDHLYTDLSFGRPDYLAQALRVMGKRPEVYRGWITRWRDRIMFGTDMVVTAGKVRRGTFIRDNLQVYRDLLERESYTSRFTGSDVMPGLALDPETLDRIYWKTFQAWRPSERMESCLSATPATVPG